MGVAVAKTIGIIGRPAVPTTRAAEAVRKGTDRGQPGVSLPPQSPLSGGVDVGRRRVRKGKKKWRENGDDVIEGRCARTRTLRTPPMTEGAENDEEKRTEKRTLRTKRRRGGREAEEDADDEHDEQGGS